MRISKRLLASYIPVVVLPLCFLGYFSFVNARSALLKEELASLENIAHLKVLMIETTFADFRKDITVADDDYYVAANLPLLTRFLHDRSNPACVAANHLLDTQFESMLRVKGFLDIMLLEPGGRVVYCVDKQHQARQLGRLPPGCSARLLGQGRKEAALSDIYVQDGRFAMLAAAPVHDPEGGFAGYLVFELDMAPVYDFIQDVTGLGDTGETLVAKRTDTGALFLNTLRHDRQAALKRTVSYGSRSGRPILEAVSGRAGSGVAVDYRGEKVLAVWRPIPALGWGLVSKIDLHEVYMPAVYLGGLILIILTAFALLAVWLVSLVTRSITEPIRRLHRDMEIVGSGDLDHRIGTSANDEIGQLSRAFDRMTRSLKQITAKRDELHRDVAERRRAEELLRQDKELFERLVAERTRALVSTRLDLEKARRLSDIGMLAATVAHELRNPLAAILMASHNLQRKTASPLLAGHFETIRKKVNESNEIINNLLFYSRIKPPNYEPVELDEILRECAANVRERCRDKGCVVDEDLGAVRGLPVDADPVQLREVFSNLLNNACDAVAAGAGKLRVTARPDGASISVRIADNGTGVDPDIVERVFDPFFTTKAKGTGLGLTVSKQIINLHGGRIELESGRGQGTTVRVEIPVRKGNPGPG